MILLIILISLPDSINVAVLDPRLPRDVSKLFINGKAAVINVLRKFKNSPS